MLNNAKQQIRRAGLSQAERSAGAPANSFHPSTRGKKREKALIEKLWFHE
jgi:hypothetical protein